MMTRSVRFLRKAYSIKEKAENQIPLSIREVRLLIIKNANGDGARAADILAQLNKIQHRKISPECLAREKYRLIGVAQGLGLLLVEEADDIVRCGYI